MKVVFFGTSEYCLPVLESLQKNFDLVLVVTRPDKPVGRKQIITPSAVKIWAEKHKVSIATPGSLKKDSLERAKLIELIKLIGVDLAVVADYGLIIPEEVFSIPKYSTFNIHFSKLPDLRGPSPVQFTLLRGDTKAWITVFKIDAKMDTGPVLWQKSYPIFPDDTTQTLYTRLFKEISMELSKIHFDYSNNRSALISQDENLATYTRFITKEDGFVEWGKLEEGSRVKGKGSREIYNRYRAMTPWPGLWTFAESVEKREESKEKKRMIIRKCHLDGGRLVLDEVQYEGKVPEAYKVVS